MHVLTTNVSHGEGNPRGSKVHAPNLHNREKNLLRINKIGPPRHFHLRACTCLRSTTNTPESLGSRVIRPPPRPAFRPCFRFPAPPSRKSAKAVLAHKWPPPPPRERKKEAAAGRSGLDSVRRSGRKVGVQGYLVKVGGLLRGLFHHMTNPGWCQRSSRRRHGEISQQQPRWSHKRKLRCVIIVVLSCLE